MSVVDNTKMAASGNPLEEILHDDVDEKQLLALASSLTNSTSSTSSSNQSQALQQSQKFPESLSGPTSTLGVSVDIKNSADSNDKFSGGNSSATQGSTDIKPLINQPGKPNLVGGGIPNCITINQGLNQIIDTKTLTVTLPTGISIRNQTASVNNMIQPVGLPAGSIGVAGSNVVTLPLTTMPLITTPGGGIVIQQNGLQKPSILAPGPQQQNALRLLAAASTTNSTAGNVRNVMPRFIVNTAGTGLIQAAGGIRIQAPNVPVRPAQQIAGQLSLSAANLPLQQNILPAGMVIMQNEQGQLVMVRPSGLQNQAVRIQTPLRPGITTTPQLNTAAGQQITGGQPLTPAQGLSAASGVITNLRTTAATGITVGTGVRLPVVTVPFRSGVLSLGSNVSVARAPLSVASTSSVSAAVSDSLSEQDAQVQLSNKEVLDDVKKCKNFLSTLLKLAGNQPATTVANVQGLIQGLIDGHVEPEAFTTRLQKELNSSPQPYLVPFLKKSLPLLRYSLKSNRMHIDGVKAPQTSLAVGSVADAKPGLVSPLVRPLFPSGTLAGSASGVIRTTLSSIIRTQGTGQQRLGTPGSFIQPLMTAGGVRGNLTHEQIVHIAQTQQHNILQQQRLRMASLLGTTGAPTSTTNHVVPAGLRFTIGSTVPTTVSPVSTMAKKSAGAATFSALRAGAPGAGLPGQSAETSKGEKRKYDSLRDDDDINDVATMGGVNLSEESNAILATNSGLISGQLRSCRDERFIDASILLPRIAAIAERHDLCGSMVSVEVAHLLSHGLQQRLQNLLEKLSVITEHRLEMYKNDERFEMTDEVKGQLKFLEELDVQERKRHEEAERGVLLRAAKSRSKLEDPEQAKLKEKAKALQAAELEEMRHKEANLTALAAIGPRRPKGGLNIVAPGPVTVAMRPRTKRVTVRDLQFLLEQEPEMSRSTVLYRTLMK